THKPSPLLLLGRNGLFSSLLQVPTPVAPSPSPPPPPPPPPPQPRCGARGSAEPLRWSPALAADAAAAAKRQRPRCEFAELGKSPYGANQAWTSYPARPAEVVASWVATGKHYDRATDTCSGGGGDDDCGTYKQVVWRRTLELGCAQATCGGGATLTLCLYYPHGNVRGQPPY
ncbi:STS14 protein-like, partial [Ananas comosus]|uniref:STS14 protein-like n=1 Tax=Ananas comosus TaxID=4615 RepID=A0A6P5FB50_ANACO